jgi:hypothetical protein
VALKQLEYSYILFSKQEETIKASNPKSFSFDQSYSIKENKKKIFN